MQGLVEPRDARQPVVAPLRKAISLGFVGKPAGARRIDHATAGDLIQGAQDLGGQSRVAEGVVHRMATQLHPLRLRTERRQRGPELQDRLAAVEMRVLDMVGDPDRIEPEILRHPCHFQRVVIGRGGRPHLALDIEA